MTYIVYVLYSDKYNRHYIGYTSDLAERLRSHNEYGKGYTSRYRPWRVIYTKAFSEKSEAMRYERWLKSGVGREFIKTLAHDERRIHNQLA